MEVGWAQTEGDTCSTFRLTALSISSSSPEEHCYESLSQGSPAQQTDVAFLSVAFCSCSASSFPPISSELRRKLQEERRGGNLKLAGGRKAQAFKPARPSVEWMLLLQDVILSSTYVVVLV